MADKRDIMCDTGGVAALFPAESARCSDKGDRSASCDAANCEGVPKAGHKTQTVTETERSPADGRPGLQRTTMMVSKLVYSGIMCVCVRPDLALRDSPHERLDEAAPLES